MYLEHKASYKNLIIKKSEMEKWEIMVNSDVDRKLLHLIFDDEPIIQKKQKKKVSIEQLFYIIFGKTSMEKLLTKGFDTY